MAPNSQQKTVEIAPTQVVVINASDCLSDVLKSTVIPINPDKYIRDYVQPALQKQVDDTLCSRLGNNRRTPTSLTGGRRALALRKCTA